MSSIILIIPIEPHLYFDCSPTVGRLERIDLLDLEISSFFRPLSPRCFFRPLVGVRNLGWVRWVGRIMGMYVKHLEKHQKTEGMGTKFHTQLDALTGSQIGPRDLESSNSLCSARRSLRWVSSARLVLKSPQTTWYVLSYVCLKIGCL